MMMPPASTAALKQGDWLSLPSTKLIRICRIDSGDAMVRYLNADGQMAQGQFVLTLLFLQLYARKVAHG